MASPGSMRRLQFLCGVGLGFVSCFLLYQYKSVKLHMIVSGEKRDNTISKHSPVGGFAYDSNSHVPVEDHAGGHLNDSNAHHDDTSVSDELFRKVRVLCWIMTAPNNFRSKADVVKATWGRRCNILLFISSETDENLQTIQLNVSEGREHLTAKSMLAFKYVYDHHFNEADWFLKCDDDTYVIVENLRYFLSTKDTKVPIFYGQHFSPITNLNYHSGGAGYVLSKEALRRFANRKSDLCTLDGGSEDLEMGKCLNKLGVTAGNSTDSLGRTRFHCFPPIGHVRGQFPSWYLKFIVEGAGGGIENISDYSVSFHYVTPDMMKLLDLFVYHLRPYGIVQRTQNIN